MKNGIASSNQYQYKSQKYNQKILTWKMEGNVQSCRAVDFIVISRKRLFQFNLLLITLVIGVRFKKFQTNIDIDDEEEEFMVQ